MYNNIYPNINYHRYDLQKNANLNNSASDKNIDSDNQKQENINLYNKPQQTFPNGTKVSIDYNKGQINISQVLTDFRNTIIAINAPSDVREEVYLYLNLVEREAKKQNPSRDIVLANLKNASKISDNYIANSLNKPSNVVEGWIDALFLQNINLKADPDEVNPNFLLEFPKKAQEKIDEHNSAFNQQNEVAIESNNEFNADTVETDLNLEQVANESENDLLSFDNESQEYNYIEPVNNKPQQIKYQNIEVESSIDISEPEEENTKFSLNTPSSFNPIGTIDSKAKDIFIKAKHLPETEQGYTEAVNMLNEALGMMENQRGVNSNIKAAIHLERGKIFDKYDYVDYALRDYFEATRADDLNLKANAFYKTGKIYDEFSEFSPALNNYLSSVAYSGEADNYKGQTKVLQKIADLYARQYDIERFSDYSSLAVDSAQESSDETLVANTYSSNAQNFQYLGDDDRALDNYKNALEIFSRNNESYEQMAYNYEQAAIVMDRLGNSLKAAKLQEKALKYYQLAQQSEEKQEAVS